MVTHCLGFLGTIIVQGLKVHEIKTVKSVELKISNKGAHNVGQAHRSVKGK